MKLVISTGNKHKLREIKSMMSGLPIEVVSINDEQPGHPEIVEDGRTFGENAVKKVAPFPVKSNLIYMSDDSGLEVDCLDGEPGIFSARYAGPDANSSALCEKVLTEIKRRCGSNLGDKTARFVCAIALKLPNGQILTVSGKVEGTIARNMRGTNGFGYDPIFIPEGFSERFSQMSPAMKNGMSHRGRALIMARSILQDYLQI